MRARRKPTSAVARLCDRDRDTPAPARMARSSRRERRLVRLKRVRIAGPRPYGSSRDDGEDQTTRRLRPSHPPWRPLITQLLLTKLLYRDRRLDTLISNRGRGRLSCA